MKGVTRRMMLALTGATALTAFTHSAEARFPRGGNINSFAGGKLQGQDNFLLQTGTYPFINVIKTMQAWTYTATGYPPIPTEFDTDGYLTTTATSGVSNILFVPPSKMGIGTTWVMTWSGRGTVFAQGSTVTSGAFSNLGGASTGRCEFWLPANVDGYTTIGVSAVQTNGSDYPRDMKMFLLSEEASLNAGNIISSDYKAKFRGVIGVYRTLDQQMTNSGLTTTWESRKSSTFYSYYADEYRAIDKDIGRVGMAMSGTSTGSSNVYAATIGTGGPANRRMLIVTWNHTQTGAATFNLNGTGAVPMIDAELMQRGPNNNPATSTLTSTLVYDADLNAWIKWGGSPSNSSGIKNGMPPEIIVQLCRELGCHPYIVVPFMAADPVSNFVSEFDNYIKASGPSWMIPRYEGPNENWNNSLGFYAYDYINLKCAAQWNTTNNGNNHWYGRTISEIGQALSTSRSNDRTKYQCLAGVQSATFGTASTSNPRMNGPRGRGYKSATFTNGSANVSVPGNTYALNDPVALITLSSSDNYPTGTGITSAGEQTLYVRSTGTTITLSLTPGGTAITFGTSNQTAFNLTPGASPAYNWVTTVCCTCYSNPDAQNQLSELQSGFDYLTSPSTALINAYQSPNTISTNVLKGSYTAWFAWANSFGKVMKLTNYEGGWSPDYIPFVNNCKNPITAVAKTTLGNFNTVLTVGDTDYNGSNRTGHAFKVGMPLCGLAISTTTQLNTAAVNVVMRAGSPGVVEWGSAHGLANNQAVTFGAKFAWNSSFDCPVTPGIVYYVKNNASSGDNTKLTISATPGGTAIDFAFTNSELVSASACWVVTAITSTTVTINCDSSTFTSFGAGSGNATYGCYGGPNGCTGSAAMINVVRMKSKSVAQLAVDTTKNYNDFIGEGGEFPSIFNLGGNRTVWAVFDPDLYVSPAPPQWTGALAF